MKKIETNHIIYTIFSVLVTVLIFGYLLSSVSLKDVASLIRDMDIRGVLMFLILSFGMSIFRAWRYGMILNVSGYAPNRLALFFVVLVRNLFSDLLPARIGSLIYIYIVTTRLGVPFGPAMSSFTLSFVFDVLALAPMIGIAALFVGTVAGMSAAVLLTSGVVLLAGSVAVLVLLPRIIDMAVWLTGRAAFLREDRRKKWSEKLFDAGRQITAARAAGIYGRLFVLSFMVRAAKYASLYMLLFALLKPLGYGFEHLPVPKVFIGICSSELAASLPVSGIAGFGVYEGTWAAVFTILGFPGSIAKLTSISHHLFTQLYGYLLGVGALLILLFPFFKQEVAVKSESKISGRAFFFYGKVITLSALMVLCMYRTYIAVTGLKTDKPSAFISGPDAGDRKDLTAIGVTGRILFDSDRGNSFGIFIMKEDGTDVQTVADSEMSEMYPDPSPDGQWVVFARAMSPHRLALTDIWICRTDGSGVVKIAANGTFPTFSADGRTVYFERDRKKVMAVDINGSNEREVFPCGRGDFSKHLVVKPRVSPDGRWVAFISDYDGGGWNSWAVELSSGRALHIGKGCEPAWFADSRHLVWVVEQGARQGSGLFMYDMETGKAEELQDAGPPLGHEYFPYVSGGDRFLLWGACPEGKHSHIDSNYQLFVKNLKNGQIARLTFDSFNNRWPKILPDAAE